MINTSELTTRAMVQDTFTELFNRWGRRDIASEVLEEYIDGNGSAHYQVPAIPDDRDPEWYWMRAEWYRIDCEIQKAIDELD